MTTDFVHLHTHSEYSLVDSLISIEDLISTAVEKKMRAIALTDHANFFAAIKFYQAAIKAGIKPILGADLWIENLKDVKKPFRLTLLCQNKIGYQNLIQLISKSYTEGQKFDRPLVQYTWLATHHEGLIALSGAQLGDIGQSLLQQQWHVAEERLECWKKIFPERFYIELIKTGNADETYYLSNALELAKHSQTPVVATNDVCFLQEEDFEAHETRICIQGGYTLNDPNRPNFYTAQQYFRDSETMESLFAEIPEALQNTIEIAKRCNLRLDLDNIYLPKFPVPNTLSAAEYLSEKSSGGLNARLKQAAIDPSKHTVYETRLQTELSVINKMGYAGYFLIVADFIGWAKANHIFVGPGRGSGAGSLVAFALGITNIDPLSYDLLFERFLNPERVSLPDFDIDFCMDNRDRVIEYVAKKYGHTNVSQIITFGTMAAKAVVRDVGRALGHPYGFVDKIAKLIPFELGITLSQALNQEEQLHRLYETDEEIKHLIDLAKKLEGLVKNAGKHAGGVVIAPSALTDFSPLYCEADEPHIVTQFDKDDIEKVGLIKFDFLGLRTLTIIDWTLQRIQKKSADSNSPPINIEMLPLDDEETFNTLRSCAITAVFQLESRGMKDLVKRLQPDSFEEIIALVALFRPGPLQSGMVDDFIDRKHGRAPIEYLHPSLESILKPTYGVILYQEQVMQIAQTLASYTLGEADLLRRAMGKKKPEEMAKQREKFVEGAKNNQIDETLANQIFYLMEKFAGYGFNKSHSAAYALLTYQTAWLKTHYPSEFMAAVLSSDMDKTDKVVRFHRECKEMKLTVLPPNINQSDYSFVANPQGEILFGLGAIKGVGFSAVENIIANRQKGPYRDLFDFCARVDLRKVNKRSIEALIQTGALDALGPHRAALLASLEKATLCAEQVNQKNKTGVLDIFHQAITPISLDLWVKTKAWSSEEQIAREKTLVGIYFTGHPLDAYQSDLKHLTTTNIHDLQLHENQSMTIAGIITQIRFMYNKRNQQIAFITIEDITSYIDVAIFSEVLESAREAVVKDQIVVIEGTLSVDSISGSSRMSARRLLTIEAARAQSLKQLSLRLSTENTTHAQIEALKHSLKQHAGNCCSISLHYINTIAAAKISLGAAWRVVPSDALLNNLRQLLGESSVILDYS
jgi:DNA polymerase III subunit alpha